MNGGTLYPLILFIARRSNIDGGQADRTNNFPGLTIVDIIMVDEQISSVSLALIYL